MLNLFKRRKLTDASFSVDADGQTHIALTFPTGWDQLTQEQLEYICLLKAAGVDLPLQKHYCFVRFGGFSVVRRNNDKWILSKRRSWWRKVRFEIATSDLAALSDKYLGWLDQNPRDLVRVIQYKDGVKKFRAVNAQLHGVRFEEFLSLENYWQGYIYTKDLRLIDRMVHILYRNKEGGSMPVVPDILRASVILWFGAWKEFCYEHWPNLYSRSVSAEGDSNPVDVESVTNMQIRALTGGDITKEKEVLDMDVWRALTELDAKAHDAKEQRRQIDQIKHKR